MPPRKSRQQDLLARHALAEICGDSPTTWTLVPHLASYVLALVALHLAGDWLDSLNNRPLLLDPPYESAHSHACFWSANQVRVGQTLGRGKPRVRNEYSPPFKLHQPEVHPPEVGLRASTKPSTALPNGNQTLASRGPGRATIG